MRVLVLRVDLCCAVLKCVFFDGLVVQARRRVLDFSLAFKQIHRVNHSHLKKLSSSRRALVPGFADTPLSPGRARTRTSTGTCGKDRRPKREGMEFQEVSRHRSTPLCTYLVYTGRRD